MSDRQDLSEAVAAAADKGKDRLELTCSEAFELAERFGVAPFEVGRVCNSRRIKITGCQLGCFK